MTPVKLFAYLQEMADTETVNLNFDQQNTTPAEIKAKVAAAFPVIADYLTPVRVAVDQVFTADNEKINLGDVREIALIPPVSGG